MTAVKNTSSHPRAQRTCPICRLNHCAVNAIVCGHCWARVPAVQKEWLDRARTVTAAGHSVIQILETLRGERRAS